MVGLDIEQQVLKFETSRKNLLSVVIFTLINLILTAFNADVSFLFSATLPQIVYEVGKLLDTEMGSTLFAIIGFVVAFIMIAAYFGLYAFSKRVRAFILVALIFFSIDSAILLFLIFDMDFSASFLLDIAFHGWVLYYLIFGTKAWFNLRGASADDYKLILERTKSAKLNTNESVATSNQDEEISETNNSPDEK
jgi:hypothetical protein